MVADKSSGLAVLLAAGIGAIPNTYPIFAFGIFLTENGIPRKWSGNSMNRFRSHIPYFSSCFRPFSVLSSQYRSGWEKQER
jgi:hypothetical protein